MYLLRSMLFTPGNNARMIQKAARLGADAVILDLEDAVPMTDKESARRHVSSAVGQVGAGGALVFVRINALTTGLAENDLESVIQPGLGGIVQPKTESRADVHTVVQWISNWERDRGLERESVVLVPLLETARGVLNAWEIATANSRIVALAFGALDFTRDMGTSPSAEGTEVFYARSRIALAASAVQVQAIDTPWIDIADSEGLTEEAARARQLGFRGKLVIHPSQIEPVNQVFSPSEEDVAHARKVAEAFRAAEARGLGAISLDGKMIDVANARRAEDLIAWAEAISQRRSSRDMAPERKE
jgi:citrate lyase subunit beta/citryl-CoA lyase